LRTEQAITTDLVLRAAGTSFSPFQQPHHLEGVTIDLANANPGLALDLLLVPPVGPGTIVLLRAVSATASYRSAFQPSAAPASPTMSQSAADRNLLFGILALQMDFVSREALAQAMNAWVLDKAKPLGQILVEQHALSSQRHALLEALVQEHLQQHGNDTQQSLAAVSSLGSVRAALRQLADPDLQASLAHVSPDRTPEDSWATAARSVGAPRSAGLRFRVLRPHAKGGLGQVSVALDEELHREVALKEIQERHADHPNSRARFVLEAEITGGLEHPGIVPVYGLGTYDDGRPYYAMRFVRGDSLKDALERFHQAEGPKRDPAERTLKLRELLGRFVAVCNAVAYAHSRGGAAPRPQARQRHARPLRRDPGRGLGTGQGGVPDRLDRASGGLADAGLGQRLGTNPVRLRHRDAGVHESGAGGGAAGSTGPGHRRLQPGGDPILPADRPGAV
jgi:hypothetical protein